MPSLGTYSASLNLLFFYMTWSTLVLSHPPIKVEIIGTLSVRFIFFIIPSTFFLLFDTLLPSLSVGIKTQGAAALPTRTGGTASTRKKDAKGQWWQVVGMSLFNILLGIAIQAGTQALCTDVLGFASPLKITTTLQCRGLLQWRLPSVWCFARLAFPRSPTDSILTMFVTGHTILYPSIHPPRQKLKHSLSPPQYLLPLSQNPFLLQRPQRPSHPIHPPPCSPSLPPGHCSPLTPPYLPPASFPHLSRRDIDIIRLQHYPWYHAWWFHPPPGSTFSNSREGKLWAVGIHGLDPWYFGRSGCCG